MFSHQTLIILAVFCAVALICSGAGIFLASKFNDSYKCYAVIPIVILAAVTVILLHDHAEKTFSADDYDLPLMAEDYGATIDYGDYDEPRLDHYLLTDEWIYRVPQSNDYEKYRLGNN